MQHSKKEMVFHFHDGTLGDSESLAQARRLQYPPVAFLPPSVYSETKATFDLMGVLPSVFGSIPQDSIRPAFTQRNATDVTHLQYNLGSENYGGYVKRRNTENPGDWRNSMVNVFVSGNYDQFVEAERFVSGELNNRAVWLAGYTHAEDFSLIQPTENPYGGESWRRFDGHGSPFLAGDILHENARNTIWDAWDFNHMWTDRIEEMYYLTADPFIRDWYEFVGEMRMRTLLRELKSEGGAYFEWGWGTRGEAHMFANSMQSYRVTGNPEVLRGIKQRLHWLTDEDPENGHVMDWRYGSSDIKAASFQNGYMVRAMLEIVNELNGTQEHVHSFNQAFKIAWAMVDRNYGTDKYAYYHLFTDGDQKTSGSGLTMVDPSVLFAWLTGYEKYVTLADDYVDGGINGGKPPYGSWSGNWTGKWEGRAYRFVKESGIDTLRPSSAQSLSLTADGTVRWTTPETATRIMVLWSKNPLSIDFTKDISDTGMRNMWSGTLVQDVPIAMPGQVQSVKLPPELSGKIYAAVIVFNDFKMSDAALTSATLE
jgi:hypothetical protein